MPTKRNRPIVRRANPLDIGGITSYFYLCKVFETHSRKGQGAKLVQWGERQQQKQWWEQRAGLMDHEDGGPDLQL